MKWSSSMMSAVALLTACSLVGLADAIPTNVVSEFELRPTTYRINENYGNLKVCVVRTRTSIADVSVVVSMTISDSTAKRGSRDYSASAVVRLTYTRSSANKQCANIQIIDDSLDESNEQFKVTISSHPPAYSRIKSSGKTAWITIVDNDDVSVIGLQKTTININEASNNFDICVIVSTKGTYTPGGTLTIHDLSARRGTDYVVNLPTNLNLRSGRHCVTFRIINDNNVEANEKFEVTLAPKGKLVKVSSARKAVVTIIDNDRWSILALWRTAQTITENVGTLRACVNLLERGSTTPRGTLRLRDITTNGVYDYTARSLNVIFSGSSSQMCVGITIVNNLIIERTEQFEISLVPSDPLVKVQDAAKKAVITITDDDKMNTIGLKNTVITRGESIGSMDLCVSLLVRGSTKASFTLRIRDITATAGKDYRATMSTSTDITTPEFCIKVEIIDDKIVEGNEQFEALLTANGPLVTVKPSAKRAVTTIVDDDRMSTIALKRAVYTISESTSILRICVDLLMKGSGTISYTLAFRDGTAIAGKDYKAQTTRNTFKSVETVSCVIVNILNDKLVEGPEKFEVTLSGVGPLVTVKTVLKKAVITITDNDKVSIIGLKQTKYTTSENGALRVCVDLLTVGSTTPSGTLTLSDGTAKVGKDYRGPLVKSVTFRRSNVSCVTIDIIDDKIVETADSETFYVKLTSTATLVSVKSAVQKAEITITDDDKMSIIGLQQTKYSKAESDGSLKVCVEVVTKGSTIPSGTLTIRDDTATQGEDYKGSLKQTIVLQKGNSQSCVSIGVVDDLKVEGNEKFEISLSSSGRPLVSVKSEARKAVVTIVDDDKMSMIGLQRTQYRMSEGDTKSKVCVVVLTQGSRKVSGSIKIRDISTSQGRDYIVSLPKILEFKSGISCVIFTIIDDDIFERNEKFEIMLSSVGELVTVEPSAKRAEFTIIDNDELNVIGLTKIRQTVPESAGTLKVCVNLLIRGAGPVTVTLKTRDISTSVGKDYQVPSTNLEFKPGSKRILCSNVKILEDLKVETDEKFQILLTASGPSVTIRPSAKTSMVTIVDNDRWNIIGLQKKRYLISEAGGRLKVCVLLLTRGTGRVSGTLDVHDISTTVGNDYRVSLQDLVFPPDSTESCVIFTIVDDNKLEYDEKFGVTLSPKGALVKVEPTAKKAIVTIIENDKGKLVATVFSDLFKFDNYNEMELSIIGLQKTKYNILEDIGLLLVCVTLMVQGSGAANGSLKISDISTNTGNSTEVMSPKDVVFAPDSRRWCVNITLFEDGNTVAEADKTEFELTLLPKAPYVIVEPTARKALVTIHNKGHVSVLFPVTTIGLQQRQHSIVEDGGVIDVCVEALRWGRGPIRGLLKIRDINTTAGEDYKPIDLDLSPDNNTYCATIEIFDDNEVEENGENFEVTLSPNRKFVRVKHTAQAAVVTIIDNDRSSHNMTRERLLINNIDKDS